MFKKDPERINPNTNTLGINFNNSKKIEDYITKSHYKWVGDVVTGPVLNDALIVYVDNSRVKKILELDLQNLIINIISRNQTRITKILIKKKVKN